MGDPGKGVAPPVVLPSCSSCVLLAAPLLQMPKQWAPAAPTPPSPKPSAPVAQTLLAQLGFCTAENVMPPAADQMGRAARLLELVPRNESFLADLEDIDSAVHRDQLELALVYAGEDGALLSEEAIRLRHGAPVSEGGSSFWALYHDLRIEAPLGLQTVGVDFEADRLRHYPPVRMTETTELTITL